MSNFDKMSKIVEFIESESGLAVVIIGKPYNKNLKEQIDKTFVESMDEEYSEFISKCEDFSKEINSEIEKKNFIFVEVEENEEEMSKLKKWLFSIEKRDFIKSDLKKVAHQKMKHCEKIFYDFAKMVYEYQQTKT
ncbi:MAG: Chromate resistance protein ChrB [Thermodesulfovibrionales bacterium]